VARCRFGLVAQNAPSTVSRPPSTTTDPPGLQMLGPPAGSVVPANSTAEDGG
jgi:hypothetical protein